MIRVYRVASTPSLSLRSVSHLQIHRPSSPNIRFYNRMSGNTPPMYTDTPLAVMPTPQFQTGNTDPFTVEASKMALSHNAFIRGFNSIYQQAPRVPPEDKSDFVGYCLAWHDCVEAHHSYEETDLFPNVNKAAGTTGLMEVAVQEHALFHDGLGRFKEYVKKEGAAFSAADLLAIMDSFKDALHSHLQAEPPMIVELAKYNTPQNPIDIAKIAEAAATKQITLSVLFNILPVFFLNMNPAEFEGGMWQGVFPAWKGPAKLIMAKGVPLWRSSWWRFASCSAEGKIKQLAV